MRGFMDRAPRRREQPSSGTVASGNRSWLVAEHVKCHDMIYFSAKNHGAMIFRQEPDALVFITSWPGKELTN